MTHSGFSGLTKDKDVTDEKRPTLNSRELAQLYAEDLLHSLLEDASRQRATVLHLEPQVKSARVRLRVDGRLKTSKDLPIDAYKTLVFHCKKLAGIPSETHLVPTEGHFVVQLNDQDYQITLHSLPTNTGEKIALELHYKNQLQLNLEQLGLWGSNLKTVKDALHQKRGLVLVIGPGKQGKTTTLYSIAQILLKSSGSLFSVEDNPSQSLEGINQIKLGPFGLDANTVLQAIAKQDADATIIDTPLTTQLALSYVQLANSQLVLSTLSATSASNAFQYLVASGSPAFLVAHSLRAIVNQRLVRRLCVHCREIYTPDKSQVKAILTALGLNQKHLTMIHALEEQALVEKLGKENKKLSSTSSSIVTLWRAGPKGCKNCQFSGYTGQIGLFEVIAPSEMTQKLLLSNASKDALQTEFLREETSILALDGMVKILRGITSPEEVLEAFALY